jgi:atypical dual specificity phosphatase
MRKAEARGRRSADGDYSTHTVTHAREETQPNTVRGLRRDVMGCAASRRPSQLTPEAVSALLPPAVSAGEPSQPRSLASKPDQILPWLYLGDHGASVSYQALIDEGITHVLNVKGGFKIPPPPYNKQLTIKAVPLDDYGSSDIASALRECSTFINTARKNGGSCLVHCSQGMNRSPSVVLGYLVTDSRLLWTLREAFLHVRARRPVISPLRVYFEQLQQIEVSVHRLHSTTLTTEESGIHLSGADK